MSLKAITSGLKSLQLASNALKISVTGTAAQERHSKKFPHPKIRYPWWYTKQNRTRYNEMLTPESKEFINEVLHEQYGPPTNDEGIQTYLHTPLKNEPNLKGTWFPNCRRSGLIGIKIGVVPQWFNNGVRVTTTMIQIVDNHVIKYIPPEEFVVNRKKYARRFFKEGKLGCLVVGSVNCDPQLFTKEYLGLFSESGCMPKRLLTRFPIHPDAAIQPGTPLYAGHFKVSDTVDITGATIYRGFQGVMKRWGFHGQPASHGSTKTHRRPGNIGSGGKKARVWPGTKMPGAMGNRHRTARGVKILRIDHKYNVIYVKGQAIPGGTNSFVYIHDTVLPAKRLKESPRFPTYYPEDYKDKPLPEEEFDAELFQFSNPSIVFEEKSQKAKK